MKYIRNYKVFENNTDLTQEQIDFLDNCAGTRWYVNPNTGFIDVQGGFDGSSRKLDDFKGLRFGNVSGSFFCYFNNLKTLDGSPRKVGGNFDCHGNPLISLEGSPLEVEGEFAINKFFSKYNITEFLKEIRRDRPGVCELLLTHHFFTPEVIKQKIQEDDNFCIAVCRAWNTLSFEKKQDELTRILSPETLQKINNSWAKKIEEDDDLCKSFCKYWNTPQFKKKQDELTSTLPPETLQKIKDFWAISGYL